MKTIIAAVALALATLPVFAAGVDPNADLVIIGQGGGLDTYVYTNTIELLSKTRIQMWNLLNPAKIGVVNGRQFKSVKMRLIYDCPSKSAYVADAVFYTERMGTGVIVGTSNEKQGNWVKAIPGTANYAALMETCKHLKR